MFKRRKRQLREVDALPNPWAPISDAKPAEPPAEEPVRREPAYHRGETILPETSHRVSSAADVDANVRRHGSAGVPRGGAGGYGGAGTR